MIPALDARTWRVVRSAEGWAFHRGVYGIASTVLVSGYPTGVSIVANAHVRPVP